MKNAPFQKISEAVKTTGLSAYYLRRGCKDGTVPHVLSGKTYYINIIISTSFYISISFTNSFGNQEIIFIIFNKTSFLFSVFISFINRNI